MTQKSWFFKHRIMPKIIHPFISALFFRLYAPYYNDLGVFIQVIFLPLVMLPIFVKRKKILPNC